MNYNNIFTVATTNDLLPPADIQFLLRKLANREAPLLRGKTYTASQVADMARRMQAGERIKKTSPYVVDFLAEQGAQVIFDGVYPSKEMPIHDLKPEQVLVSPPVPRIVPVDSTVAVKEQVLKTNNGMIDVQGVRVDKKRYKYGVSIKEDISFFCTYVKVDQREETFVWTGLIKPVGPYTQFDLEKGIPFAVLDTMVPQKKMKGLQLYEFLLEHVDYHKMIRTVVAYLLEDDTVPLMENGVQAERDGAKVLHYANALRKKSDCSEIIREYRPAPLSFKVKTGYGGAKYIETMLSQVNKKNFLRVNNAYYDGLDASIDRDGIRSKIEIIMEYAHNFPTEVIIVTGIEEEGLALKKALSQIGREAIILNERSASNYKLFKIWMKEKNIEDNIAIGEKLIVQPVIAKDGAILRAVYKNQYARGFGFMTNLLVHHYAAKDCPTSTAVGTREIEHCEVGVDEAVYVFKQLPSKKPLHYYPYIYDEPKIVEKYIGTNLERITRTWRHMWTLLSWPKSKMPYISRFYYCPTIIFWRKGKDIMDFTVENEDFKEIVRSVKLEDDRKVVSNTVVMGKKNVVQDDSGPPTIDMNTRIIQNRPVPVILPRESGLGNFSFTTPPPRPSVKEKNHDNALGNFSFGPSSTKLVVTEKALPPEKEESEVIESDDDNLEPE